LYEKQKLSQVCSLSRKASEPAALSEKKPLKKPKRTI